MESDSAGSPTPTLSVSATTGEAIDGLVPIRVVVETDAEAVSVTVNGLVQSGVATSTGFVIETTIPEAEHARLHSEWRGPYGSVVVVRARTGSVVVGDYTVVGGVA